MDKIQEFYEIIKKDETIILATSADKSVTMRVISPVYYKGKVLFFTNNNSKKYLQLLSNNNCCISARHFFAEATAEFFGSTMKEENKELRDVYNEKFPGAFDEGIEYGGRNSDFVILTLNRLYGWNYENNSDAGNEFPTSPFEVMF